MTRLNKIAFTAVAFTFALTFVPNADACGRGRSGGYSSSYSRPSYNYSRPTYHAPSYSRPVYSTPAPQPVFTQPVSQPAPQVISQPAPQQQFVQQAPVRTAPIQNAPAPQPAPVQPAPQQITQQQPAPQPNALDTALQALGGFAPQPTAPQQSIPQQPAPQQTAPQHVGTFKATLGNGATVELTLDANGQFNWSAVNGSGAKTSFSGTYEIGNGSLSLTRSNDSQKLAGSLTGLTANGFSFQLGSNSAALSFVRG